MKRRVEHVEQQAEAQAVVVDEAAQAPPGLVPVEPPAHGVIRPVASAEEVLAAWQQFQDLKRSLLTLDDYQDIQGRARIKKSGWRKIAAAFGISDQLLRQERRECEGPGPNQRYFVWEVSVRAVAPNGRYADAVGSCASNERRFAHVDHDVRAVAHCVPLRAEILTRRGFCRYDAIEIGEEVLAYDPVSDTCRWAPLQNVTVYESLPMIELRSKSFRVQCTPDHSWAVRTEVRRAGSPRRWLCPTNEFPSRGAIITAAPAPDGDSPLEPEDAALLGWILTEGTVRKQYVVQQYKQSAYRNGPYLRVHIDQSKPQYVSELRELLGARASERVSVLPPRTYPQGHSSPLRPSHRFELRSSEARALLARAGIESLADLPALVTRLSRPARRAMLEAMLKGDGGRHGSTWVFSQAGTLGLDVFHLLAALEGLPLGRLQVAHPGVGNGPCYRQTIRRRRFAYLPALSRTALPPEAAWCPTTALGTWVMRLDGQITITGNTRAKNRAVADLVGGGEVSAEEIEGELHAQAVLQQAPGRGSRVDGPRPIDGEAPASLQSDPVTEGQLRAIRAHLRRTGIDEERACAKASVERLEALTRRQASDLLAQLARQPNVA